ncbi:hypothetical protein LUQ84_002046 [Hamiltosporidium tvaerminnensis]|nr:hypothetical protein LUQ84_002046 [Hamiltosporidium tvaerminnensis]
MKFNTLYITMPLLLGLIGVRLTVLFVLFYLYVCKKPSVFYVKTARNFFIYENTPSLSRRFYPFILGFTPHVQSFFGGIRSKGRNPDQCLKIKAKDGCILTVDVFEPTNNNPYYTSKEWGVNYKGEDICVNKGTKEEGVNNSTNEQQSFNKGTTNLHPLINSTNTQHPVSSSTDEQHPVSNTPYKQHPFSDNENSLLNIKPFNYYDSSIPNNVILVHGFNGSSYTSYIRNLALHLSNENFRVFGFNARGVTNLLESTTFFHIGWTEDLHVLVNYIIDNYTGYISIIGFSLGGAWTVKISSEITNPRFKCGVAVSVPLDFIKIKEYMLKPVQRKLYNRMLTNKFKQYFIKNWKVFEKEKFKMKDLLKCQTIQDIDLYFTSKVFKFKDLESYYEDFSGKKFIPKIKIPFMILNSVDDPLIPEFSIPKKKCEENENIFLVLFSKGGHVGFLGNNFYKTYTEEVVVEFLKAVHERLKN